MAGGSPLAEAFVRLRFDTSQAKPDIEQQLGRVDLTNAGKAAGGSLGKGIQAGVATPLADVQGRSKAAFGSLANLAGQSGLFAPLQGAIQAVGDGLSAVTENGQRTGTVMLGVGTAVAAVGGILTAASQKDLVAHRQLRAAIEATGRSYDAFEAGVEKAVRSGEHFGHVASDTETALRKLTDSTGDPAKALQYMGLVTDLAASKNTDLATAATLVAKILDGRGGKAVAAYGIHIDKSKNAAAEASRALSELSAKLSGQAAASADTFGGHVEAAKTRVEDFTHSVGAKAGPALTILGTALGAVGSAIEIGGAIKGARSARALAAAETEAAAAAARLAQAEGLAAAETAGLGVAADGAAAANTRLGAAMGGSASGSSKLGLAMKGTVAAAVGVGALEGVVALSNRIQRATLEAAPGVSELTLSLLQLDQTSKVTGALADTFGKNLAGLGEEVHRLVDPGNVTRVNDFLNSLAFGSKSDALAKATQDVDALDEALAGMVSHGQAPQAASDLAFLRSALKPGDFDKLLPKLNDYRDATGRLKVEAAGAAVAGRGQAAAMTAGGSAAASAAPGYNQVKDAITGMIRPMTDLERELRDLDVAFGKVSGRIGVDEALINAKEAQLALAKSLRENGRSFDINTEKGRANKKALDDVGLANLAVYDAEKKSGASSENAKAAYNRQTLALEGVLRKARVTADNVKTLTGRVTNLAALPPARPILGIRDQLSAPARKAQRLLDDLDGRVVTATLEFQAKLTAAAATKGSRLLNQLDRYGSGGDYPARRPFIAGERGPEIIWPGKTAGTVISNDKLREVSGTGGGGPTINIGAINNPVPERASESVVTALRRQANALRP